MGCRTAAAARDSAAAAVLCTVQVSEDCRSLGCVPIFIKPGELKPPGGTVGDLLCLGRHKAPCA